ncbi:MAG: PQQ-binding-like beta-propeller repeat protein [Tepidisphaeraceae bacterium]
MKLQRSTFAAVVLAIGSLTSSLLADWRFVHISDAHFNTSAERADVDRKMLAEIVALEPKPQFIVNTGDNAETGAAPEYERMLSTLGDALQGVPIYTAPGNHDVRWNPLGKEGFTRGTKQPLYQHWSHEGMHFFTLDSTVMLEHHGHISQQQLDWLAGELKSIGPDAPVVIGFHHWVGRESMMVDNEQAFLDTIKDYNVVLLLQGHGHSDIQWNINGIPAVMQKGLYQGSYMTIDVTKDELVLKRRSIVPPKELVTTTAPTTGGPSEKQKAALVGDVKWKEILRTPLDKAGRPVSTKPTTTPTDTRAFRWKAKLGGAVQSRLVLDAGKLYVTTMAGELACIDAATGAVTWTFKAHDSIFSAPCVDGGTVYVGSADHFVYAINSVDGTVKWKQETGAAVIGGASVARGVVCIGSADTKIYGLSATDGTVLWTVQGANLFQASSATDGQRFFVGGWDNYFRAIDAGTGKEVWSKPLGREQKMLPNFSAFAPAITTPAVGQNLVFISTNDGKLHALRTMNGDEVWTIDRQKMGYSSPCFANGTVYGILSDESKAFAVNARSGEMLWETTTGGTVYDSSFAYDGGKLFVATVAGELVCLNATDGKQNWRYRLGTGHAFASPAAGNGTVYMSGMSGEVLALPGQIGSR